MTFLSLSKRIRHTLLIAVLALASIACGRQQNRSEVNLGSFAPYAERFQKTAAEQGVHVEIDNLVIQFGELSNPRQNGLCELTAYQTPTITIRQEIWDQMEDVDREELIFHEMGHCVLGREHTSVQTSDGIPESIMNPYRISNSIYETNREYYISELFHPTTTN